jgi:phosphoglycerate dehydrogenase-like enzyme
MATAKDLLSRDRSMRAGNWINQPLMPMRKSTLGIVGLGRIGRSLALKAQAMQMKILAMEPDPDKSFVQENGIHLVDLDYLLQNSDYVSLHCALSDNTQGLIDAGKLALMKHHAVLINTARGGLIVENDLVAALKSGQIRSAGLDVFEVEPTHHDNPIHNLDNVILSPHIAGSDKLSFEDTGNEAAKNIIDLFEGSWPDEAVINKQLRSTWKW